MSWSTVSLVLLCGCAFFWVLAVFFLHPLLDESARIRSSLEAIQSDGLDAEKQRSDLMEKLQYVLNYLSERRGG